MSTADHTPDSFSAHDAVSNWVQDIAPYGIFTTDASLKIRSWNQWLATRGPWVAEKIIGQPLGETFPELVARRFLERYQRALNGEISVLSSALHKHLLPIPVDVAGSEIKTMLQTVRIAPLLAGKEIVGTITIIEDVTEREIQAVSLQRQQQHDSMLSRALSVLLRSEDPMKDIAELLPSFSPHLGVDVFFTHTFSVREDALKLSASGGLLTWLKDELQRFPLGAGPVGPCAVTHQIVVLPDLTQIADEHYAVLRSSGMRHFAGFPIVLGDQLFGTLAVGSYVEGTLPADEVKFLATLVQYLAISLERVSRQEQLATARITLQEHANSLEGKVVERTSRLNETIAQLESFSYTIAHDLRAPIRALIGYSEALEDEFSAQLPAEAQVMVSRLKTSSKRLDALTRDLLKFSKISSADIEMTTVDITDLVRAVVAFSPDVERIVTVKAPLGIARAHDILLRQCFVNIFENAMKFSAPERNPTIVVWSEIRTVNSEKQPKAPAAFNPAVYESTNGDVAASPRGSDQRLRIWIEDNGVGIPPHARSRIFGIFERVTATANVEGTGIGLAIVARAMQQMGGSCGVDSELGTGSRFWLELHIPA
ncbi:sensor histidine kinase [Oleiharenicola lentus]|uniref:sensor histidine kinase n=1 Tax=Oleiharenicola lentus TaxID=2508720 RepID=UPI003F66C894